MRVTATRPLLPSILIGIAAVALALPGAAGAASCPTAARQLSSTQVQYDSTCIVTAADWRSLGGSTANPPQPTAWQMSMYKTAPPYRSASRMMSLLTQYDAGDCDPRTCRGRTPGYKGNRPPPGPEGPAIKPICPPGYVVSYIPSPGGGTTTGKYTCVCYMWTIDDIDNPLFPPDLAAIIEAGGYIPPTQYCILVPVTSSRRSTPSFVPARLVSTTVKGSPPTAAPDQPVTAKAAASPIYRFRQVARISLAKPGDRIGCGLNPMVALGKLLVKDPADPTQNVVVGTGLGTICRLKVVKVRTPRLTSAQRRLVARGNVAVAFKVIGLPAIGSRERARTMPYAAVKFFGPSAAPANGNRYRMVQANSRGIAVWIGKFRKTARYTVRAAWPFYQFACASYRFNRTKRPSFTG